MTNLLQIENIEARAKQKINDEFEKLGNIGQKEKAVSTYVHNVLCDACDQSEEFASVIYEFKRTLKDCLVDIMKGAGNAISDIDVYRKAIQFYFPNSEINCVTTITLTGEPPSLDEVKKESPVEKKEVEKKESKANKELNKEESKAEIMQISSITKKPKKSRKKDDSSSSIQLTLF